MTPKEEIILWREIGQSNAQDQYKNKNSQEVVVHAFNPSTRKGDAGDLCSLRPAWSTRASSRKTRAVIHKNSVLQNQKKKRERA